jgi:hypothetical protein
MKILLVNSFLAVITVVFCIDGSNTKLFHNGQIVDVMDSAKDAHFNHGDEPAVLYNGHWIPQSTFEAFREPRASAERASSLVPQGTRHMTFGEWNEYDD